ncbi:matrixin family metalloprotease, partial [Profundibacter sp.]
MPTPSQDVTSLIGDGVHIRWNLGTPLGTGVVVTYSFPSTAAAYDTDSEDSFQALGAAYHANVRAALDVWSQAAGITFVEVPEAVNGEMRFSMFDMSGNTVAGGGQTAGFAYYPSYSYTSYGDEDTYFINYQSVGGDVFLNSAFYGDNANSIALGADGFSVLVHEIGHAIGFQHPHDGGNIITPGHDNGAYTIMSYNRTYAQSTLGTVDVEASQYLYGTSSYAAFWDAANAAIDQTGTNASDWLRGTILADIIHGDDGDDRLDGLEGNDILYGGDGRDILNGGDGDDTLVGGATTDDLRDVIYGGAGNDTIDGGYGNDELRGDAGDDNMAGGFGADLVIGGAGNDVMTGS